MFVIPVFIFLLGLITGSFLKECIIRIPEYKSLIIPPSHCNDCGRHFPLEDMIPVLGYMALGGKCRYCGGKLPYFYPLVEVITAVVFTVFYLNFGLNLTFFSGVVFSCILIILMFTDIRKNMVPDIFIAIIIFGALFMNFMGMNVGILEGLTGSLLGVLLMLVIGLMSVYIFKRKELGANDIKLMAAVGLFLGWKGMLVALVLSIYACALTALVLVIIRRWSNNTSIPYTPFIALGSIISLLYGNLIVDWYVSCFFNYLA